MCQMKLKLANKNNKKGAFERFQCQCEFLVLVSKFIKKYIFLRQNSNIEVIFIWYRWWENSTFLFISMVHTTGLFSYRFRLKVQIQFVTRKIETPSPWQTDAVVLYLNRVCKCEWIFKTQTTASTLWSGINHQYKMENAIRISKFWNYWLNFLNIFIFWPCHDGNMFI